MNFPINILYQDNYLLAIEKPSGLVINRAETQKNDTLEDYLEKNREELGIEKNLERQGIVHRLDKETSGVILVAKTSEALSFLQTQFKERTVSKLYTTIVLGKVKESNFVIDAPIGRNPNNREKFAVIINGRDAKTTFKTLKTFEKEGIEFSLLEAKPHTGRTHQIRVHLQALGHPVAGDKLYLGKRQLEKTMPVYSRLMLHATSLSLPHPDKEKSPLTVESVLPDAFLIS